VRYVSNHIEPKIVLIVMSVWLGSLGLSLGPLTGAAEPLEDSFPRVEEEIHEAKEHLRLGVDFYLTDELEVAIDEFREATQLQPDYGDAYHNLGVALAKTGDLSGAITAWTKAERLDPGATSLGISLPSLVAYNYGVSLVRRGQVEQAMNEWQAALRIQPDFPEAHYALGLAFLAVSNPAVATAHIQAALSLAPDWAEAQVALGRAHYESHEYGQARTAWLKALALNPREAGIYAKLGHLAIQEGNYHEAIDYSRQAVALQSDLGPAHFHLGMAFLAQGQQQASIESFDHALALDARFTPARLWLGVAWSRMGNWAKAANSWREALQQDPFGPDTFWLHHNLGMALAAMGHVQDAIKEFQWVVEQRPEWAEGWSQLGVTLMSERRWGEGLAALETAVQLEPNWAHLYFAFGKAHAEQGDLTLAVQAFQRAVNIAPNFVDALYHLGIVLRANNQLGDAVDPLRQAAEGGSRDAQLLLASMYVNGNGMDRNVPLAMLWWSRSSRGSISDTITRTAQNQLAQLRRRLHREQFTPIEHQDVLTGFGLIRQDLANHAPAQLLGRVRPGKATAWDRGISPRILLPWMIERALALDMTAQAALREWFVDGVTSQSPVHHSALQDYWLQVAKEGDPVGCELIESTFPQETVPAIRKACFSLEQ